MKKKLLILVLIVVIIFEFGALLVLNYNQNDGKSPVGSIQNTIELCEASGQSTPLTEIEAPKQDDSIPTSTNKETSEIFARVLDINPLVLEIFNTEINAEFSYINNTYKYPSVEIENIEKLKFGDFITANEYSYTYESIELAIGSALDEVKIISKEEIEQKLQSTIPSTLVHYVPISTNSNAKLIIMTDGRVYYRDNYNNTFSDKQLNQQELELLVQQFQKVNFDNLDSNPAQSTYSPSVTLICNRYQHVDISINTEELTPLTDHLDTIIEQFSTEANRYLRIEETLQIKDWDKQYDTIAKLNEYNTIAFRQGKIYEVSSYEIPVVLRNEIENTNTVYRYENELYFVSINCIWDFTGYSWACLNVILLDQDEYQEWPSELNTSLLGMEKDQPRPISNSDYLNNQEFYDSLLEWNSSFYYIEDDIMYRHVRVGLN